MKKYICIVGAIVALAMAAGPLLAAGGADYGRGAETDPVAGAALTVETNRAQVAEAALSTRVDTSTNVTALLDARLVVETNRAQVAEAAIASSIQAGVATSGQAIVFSPIYSAAPALTCTAVGPSTHVFRATVPEGTNATINANAEGADECFWIAVPKTQ